MKGASHINREGFTIVELMVGVLILIPLVTVIGFFLASLFNAVENERNEARVREWLVATCARYADMMSMGSSILIDESDASNFAIKFPMEDDGVVLDAGGNFVEDTNTIDHVSCGVFNTADSLTALQVDFYTRDANVLSIVGAKKMDDGIVRITKAPKTDIVKVDCSISPLKVSAEIEKNKDADFPNLYKYDSALGLLRISAAYKIRTKLTKTETREISVERIVRLWNYEDPIE